MTKVQQQRVMRIMLKTLNKEIKHCDVLVNRGDRKVNRLEKKLARQQESLARFNDRQKAKALFL